MKAVSIAAAAAFSLAFPTISLAQDMSPGVVDVVEVASAADQHKTFLDAAIEAELAEPLATTQDITVFAPIDAAFGSVEGLDEILADRERLAGILELHVVPARYLSSDLPEGDTSVETLAGETITITNDGGNLTITTPSGSEAMVVQADQAADNGVLHGIDTVLLP